MAEPNKAEPAGQVIEAHILYISANSDGGMCSHVAAKIQYADGHIEERELELPVSAVAWHPPSAKPATRDDGLTAEEGVVMDHIVGAVNQFVKLPVQHPNDTTDFVDAIHRLQDLMAVRIARRHYPHGWANILDDANRPPSG